MFGGWNVKAATTCPNCGKSGWKDQKDYECGSCGFKKIDSEKLPDITLIFCGTCGCIFGVAEEPACPSHGPGEHIAPAFKK